MLLVVTKALLRKLLMLGMPVGIHHLLAHNAKELATGNAV
jgi:hypothetical protein